MGRHGKSVVCTPLRRPAFLCRVSAQPSAGLFDVIIRSIIFGKLEADFCHYYDLNSASQPLPPQPWTARLLHGEMQRPRPRHAFGSWFLKDLRRAVEMLHENDFRVPKSLAGMPEPYEYVVCVTASELWVGNTIFFALCQCNNCMTHQLRKEDCKTEPPEHPEQIALRTAVRFGDVPTVRRLLKRGVSLEGPNWPNKFESIMSTACRHGQGAVVKDLLCRGARVLGHYWNSRSPFDLALEQGYLEIAKLLLEHIGTDTLAPREVHYGLCYCRDERAVRFLLQHNATGHSLDSGRLNPFREVPFDSFDYAPPFSKCNMTNQSPFHNAVRSGSTAVARMFLEHVTDVRTVKKVFYWALIRTVELGYCDTCRMLLEYYVDMPESWVEECLLEAVRRGRFAMVELLMEHGGRIVLRRDIRPLAAAASNGNLKITQLLLDNGGSCRLEWKNKPLVEAVAKGHLDVIRLLLQHIPRLNMAHKYGCYAIARAVEGRHGAIPKGQLDIIRLLLQHMLGSTLHKSGRRLICRVVRSGRLDIMKIVVERQLDLTKCRYLLHEAVHGGSEDMVRLVLFDLDRLDSINALDGVGYTATTHAACRPENPKVLPLLLDHGGRVMAKDSSNADRLRALWPVGTFKQDFQVRRHFQ